MHRVNGSQQQRDLTSYLSGYSPWASACRYSEDGTLGPPEHSQTGLPLQLLGQEGWGCWDQGEAPGYKPLSSGWRAQV